MSPQALSMGFAHSDDPTQPLRSKRAEQLIHVMLDNPTWCPGQCVCAVYKRGDWAAMTEAKKKPLRRFAERVTKMVEWDARYRHLRDLAAEKSVASLAQRRAMLTSIATNVHGADLGVAVRDDGTLDIAALKKIGRGLNKLKVHRRINREGEEEVTIDAGVAPLTDAISAMQELNKIDGVYTEQTIGIAADIKAVVLSLAEESATGKRFAPGDVIDVEEAPERCVRGDITSVYATHKMPPADADLGGGI